MSSHFKKKQTQRLPGKKQVKERFKVLTSKKNMPRSPPPPEKKRRKHNVPPPPTRPYPRPPAKRMAPRAEGSDGSCTPQPTSPVRSDLSHEHLGVETGPEVFGGFPLGL